jgi:hypothetical protein
MLLRGSAERLTPVLMTALVLLALTPRCCLKAKKCRALKSCTGGGDFSGLMTSTPAR